MKPTSYAIAAAALLALGSAQAQTSDAVPGTEPGSGDTIIIVTPPEGSAPGSTAVFTPPEEQNRALTRAEIKAETREAVRAGTPRGELGQSEGTAHMQPADGTAQRMPVRP